MSCWGHHTGICDRCARDGLEVELHVDPFIAEIYPEDTNEETWWCEDCYDERYYEV